MEFQRENLILEDIIRIRRSRIFVMEEKVTDVRKMFYEKGGDIPPDLMNLKLKCIDNLLNSE